MNPAPADRTARMSCHMKNRKDSDLPPRIKARHLALHPATIEKTFTDAVMDLKEVIVLDGIDILPDKSGFRVRCHDLHGLLPEIVVKDSGDTFQDKDRLGNQACKLIAIVRLRDEMARFLPGCKLLRPRAWAAGPMPTPHGKHGRVSQSTCFVRL